MLLNISKVEDEFFSFVSHSCGKVYAEIFWDSWFAEQSVWTGKSLGCGGYLAWQPTPPEPVPGSAALGADGAVPLAPPYPRPGPDLVSP